MMTLQPDHVVVGAASLEQGRAWAVNQLGVEPLLGGRHASMATHNMVLRLDDPEHELYLEILAIDPDALEPGRARWFDLDTPEVRAALAVAPRLIAWVARSDDLALDHEQFIAAGLDPGPIHAATRDMPSGELRWRITIPDDGARVAGGAIPTLIAWDTPSPAASLPESGVSLERLVVRGVAGGVAAMLGAAGAQVAEGGGPALRVALRTPAGMVEIDAI
jgi:hypothetical protein